MHELFGDRLVAAIADKQAPICVGIDPIFEMLPDAVAGPAEDRNANDANAAIDAIFDFTISVLRIVAPHIPIVKFQSAYFEKYPNVWRHGDWCEITAHGGFIIYGRSDAVLNPGGVRIGTAEIYRQVESLEEVVESLVIGQDWQGDVRVVLFVRLRDGLVLDDALRARIRERVKSGASPRHVPARIAQVPDIPRTRSGKIVELAVRDVVHGRPIANREALANPEALAHFASREELST